MTNSPDAASQTNHADIEGLYRAVSTDSRYGHYVRIPERICRCLEHFGVASDRAAVGERLHSYYLFIGVVDDAIDSHRLEAGGEIIERLVDPTPSFGEEARRSHAGLTTECLKRHIGPEIYESVLAKLTELYGAVVGERRAATMRAYIEQRRAVGRLTAELSYLLIRPLLVGGRDGLCRFFLEVGEVGCLVDSVVDLRSDGRLGLLGFRPTTRDYLVLVAHTLRAGACVLAKHPRLLGLFLDGVGDVLLDRFRARRSHQSPDVPDNTKNEYACERAA